MATRNRIFLSLIVGLFVISLPLWRFVSKSKAVDTITINLPLLFNLHQKPTVFGGEVYGFLNPQVINLTVDANVTWLRIPAFDWSQIEPNAPVNGVHTYDWSSVPENSIKNFSSNDIEAVLMVHKTPSWAQKLDGVYCGPIAEAHLSDFAAFLRAVVQRYGQDPYNVRYWQLGNEPDIDPAIVPPDSGYGCWGDQSDSYYGGGYYAEMLKVAYPAIKSIDPQAKVVLGGLLLDCDPEDVDCTDPLPAKFFEGVLQNNGADYFDIASFHGYPFYYSGQINEENHPKWDRLGGVVIGKIVYLRDLMNRYGVNKPLLHTEGALLCPEANTQDCDPPSEAYEDAKADYVVWLYTRAIAYDLEGSLWYTFDNSGGWRDSSVIGDPNDPNPAYYSFKFLSRELMGAQYTGQLAGIHNNLRAYTFRVPGKTVWVVWSADGNLHPLALPTGYTQIYDKLGNPVSVSGDEILVNSPIYVELP